MTDISQIFQQYQNQVEAWQNNKQYSREYRAAQIKGLTGEAYSRVQAEVKRQFGHIGENGTLEGGALWQELEQARQAIKAAQNNRPQPDHLRLRNTIEYVKNDLADFRSPAELKAWYQQADIYEKMALQSLRTTVKRHFFDGNSSGLGSLLEQLKRDRHAAQVTPELEQAQAKLSAVDKKFREAYQQAEQVAKGFGESQFLGHSTGPILGILTRVAQDAAGNLHKAEPNIVRIKSAERPYVSDQPAPAGTKLNFSQ